MTRVGIAELKAHLSQYLREAKGGDVVEVLDRGVPVARIVPAQPGMGADALGGKPAHGKLTDLPTPPPSDFDFDIVEELLKDRRKDRLR